MSDLPYVPPFSESDVPPELVMLFLEAVARVTPAFADLRDSVLPYFQGSSFVNRLNDWVARWHLDFDKESIQDEELGHDVLYRRQSLVNTIVQELFNILKIWSTDEAARNELQVATGFWKRPLRMSGDREPIAVQIAQWNMQRESFESYRDRLRAFMECFIEEQKSIEGKKAGRFDLRQYSRRSRDRGKLWDFEWLALWTCCGVSDSKIAKRAEYSGVTAQGVKQARLELQSKLGISPKPTRIGRW